MNEARTELYTKQEVVNILRRLHRRAQCRAIYLTNRCKKNKWDRMTMMRAMTWEKCCLLIEGEINSMGGSIYRRFSPRRGNYD